MLQRSWLQSEHKWRNAIRAIHPDSWIISMKQNKSALAVHHELECWPLNCNVLTCRLVAA